MCMRSRCIRCQRTSIQQPYRAVLLDFPSPSTALALADEPLREDRREERREEKRELDHQVKKEKRRGE